MILTASPRNDGAVTLTAPAPANYEVYRSADNVNFVKIGEVTSGTTYKDFRPHMKWEWHPPTEATQGGTWGTNEYFQFAFTGRKIGIQANKYGDGTDPRGKVMAGIYEDGVSIDTVDLSTPHNTDPASGGEEYNGMMVWAKDYKDKVTKTIKIQRSYSAKPLEWGVVVNGYWIETGEQVIQFGQQGYYKFKDKGTGIFSDVATVTPNFDYSSRLDDIFNGILDFQLAQPSQVINVTPARSTPYLMWKALPFAWAYMVTGQQKYKDAADRQFTLAQTLKYNGNICFDLPGVSSYYGMPDYNARHANSAMWCYKIFGDIRYLREAEQVAEAARVTYATYSYRGFSPVCYNYAVQDWFASIGCMFAQLWANPDSIYYQSTTYLNLAKASLGCWLTFQNPTTGEIEMNRDTGVSSYPDGVYSQFALSNAYVANAVLRNSNGTPVMPELETGLAKAYKWETKYSVEPMTFYNAIYHDWGGPGGASRISSAYEETKAGRYTFEDWQSYYREHIGPAYYASVDRATTGGTGTSYWPPGTEMVDQDWYSKNMINVAFGPVMAYAAGVPNQWVASGISDIAVGSNTIQCSADTQITVLANTIQCSADTLITVIEVSQPAPIELAVNGSINIPGSVSMGIYSALPAVALELAASGTIDIPASVKMRIMKIVRNLGRTSTYRFKEKPEQFTFKEIPDRYTWKGAEKLYQYILGETKPVQVDWSRKDGKDFTITSAIYAFEDLAEEQLSISGKSTLTNLTPTATGTKYCIMEAELTPIDSTLPIEYRLAEVQVVTRKRKGA